MPHIDAAIAEMSGAIDELGKVGVTMNTSILYLHPVGNRGRSPLVSEHLGGARPVIPLRADDHVAWETTDIRQPPSQAAHRLWDYTVSHCPRSGSAMRHRHIRPGGGLHRRDGRSQRRARHTGANAMALFGIRA
jgi:hypothetical protein